VQPEELAGDRPPLEGEPEELAGDRPPLEGELEELAGDRPPLEGGGSGCLSVEEVGFGMCKYYADNTG